MLWLNVLHVLIFCIICMILVRLITNTLQNNQMLWKNMYLYDVTVMMQVFVTPPTIWFRNKKVTILYQNQWFDPLKRIMIFRCTIEKPKHDKLIYPFTTKCNIEVWLYWYWVYHLYLVTMPLVLDHLTKVKHLLYF